MERAGGGRASEVLGEVGVNVFLVLVVLGAPHREAIPKAFHREKDQYVIEKVRRRKREGEIAEEGGMTWIHDQRRNRKFSPSSLPSSRDGKMLFVIFSCVSIWATQYSP